MALIGINHRPSTRDLRQFAGLWFPLFWVIVGAIVSLTTGSWRLPAALAGAGVLVGAVGLARPAFMRPIFLIWMYAAFPIGWVISHLVLGVVYFLVVTPIGLIMRAVGYDPMRRRLDRGGRSYWIPCDTVDSKRYYFRQY